MKKAIRTIAASALVLGIVASGAGAAQADTQSGKKNCAAGYSAVLKTSLSTSGVGDKTTKHVHKSGTDTRTVNFTGFGPNSSNSYMVYSVWTATSERVIAASTSCLKNPV